jgi:hypothetical protein
MEVGQAPNWGYSAKERKEKLSLKHAMEDHRIVGRRGSRIF